MADNFSALMQTAVSLAQEAMAAGEVPIGAVIANESGQILATAKNEVELQQNPLAHAELLALMRAIQKTGQKYLQNCTLAVTLEPCAMCAQAIAHARIGTLVFGAYDPKSGGTTSNARVLNFSHHKLQILGGIEEDACAALLKTFFATKRDA